MSADRTTEDDRSNEVEDLRERVAALESELADRAARANDALAAAQDRTYWLDRWHLDLNALMARPVPARLWKLMPAARAAYRGVRSARKSLAKARLERQLAGGDNEAGPGATRAAHLDVPGVLRAVGVSAGGERILALGPTTGTSPGDVGWDESAAGAPPLPTKRPPTTWSSAAAAGRRRPRSNGSRSFDASSAQAGGWCSP